MPKSPNWTRRELIVAFNLHLKLPFGKLHTGTKAIQDLADLVGRSHSSMAMRLNNFASVYPYHQQRGVKELDGGRRQVEPIWNEFINYQEDLVFESERILAEYQHKTIAEVYPDIEFDLKDLRGEVKMRYVKTRVNQRVFREMILKTYENRCAISGIDIPELLVAGHIVPWVENEHERLNPENGLCLSNLYDKAYEKGLICIDVDYRILISKELRENSTKLYYDDFFGKLAGKAISLPRQYKPRQDFIQYRLDRFNR